MLKIMKPKALNNCLFVACSPSNIWVLLIETSSPKNKNNLIACLTALIMLRSAIDHNRTLNHNRIYCPFTVKWQKHKQETLGHK